jgi:hypothetical protein
LAAAPLSNNVKVAGTVETVPELKMLKAISSQALLADVLKELAVMLEAPVFSLVVPVTSMGVTLLTPLKPTVTQPTSDAVVPIKNVRAVLLPSDKKTYRQPVLTPSWMGPSTLVHPAGVLRVPVSCEIEKTAITTSVPKTPGPNETTMGLPTATPARSPEASPLTR